ncbi:MAG: ADOP family duplicated permease [Gemmatimonadales bacterium]
MPSPRQFRLPFRRARELGRDIDAELSHHLAAATDDLVRQGVPHHEALLAASTRLADKARIRRDLLRQDRRAEWENRIMTAVGNLRQDLQFAARLARRRSGTSILIVLTLAIGIGVATTFAGTVDALLLRPLALDRPERVVSLWRVPTATGIAQEVAPGTVVDWHERASSFEALAGAEPYSLAFDDGSGPRSIGTWRVTEGYFDVMRSVPVHGRLLEARDYADGADPVVVVSHSLWATRLGADPDATGRILPLGNDRTPFRVVGVLPADFPYTDGRDLYVPRVLTGEVRSNRFANYFPTVARLAPGVSREAAATELREIAAATALEYPESDEGFTAEVAPLAASISADVRPGLLLLLLAATLILLIACVNAASLLLAEATRRARELAIRAALGAGRGRIVRQLITEALLLGMLAGSLGIAITVGGLAAFRRLAPTGMPRLNELTLDIRLVLLGALISVLVALLVSVPTALRIVSADLHPALKPGGKGGLQSPTAMRVRGMLVATQVSLAVVLLAGGGLLLRSWMAITATDQGYAPRGVAGAEAHVWGTFPDEAHRLAFANRIVSRLEEAPGVAATIITTLPLTTAIGDEDAEVALGGATAALEALGLVAHNGYFGLMGIEVLEGRGIDQRIRPDGEAAVVVNASLARRFWPAGGAVGSLLQVSYGGPAEPRRIIGVVADVRYHSLEREPGPTVYLPYAQNPGGSIFVVARSPESGTHAASLIRQSLRELAPTVALDLIVTLDEQVWLAGKARRFSLLLLTAFGAISALLTGIGLFGLMAHTIRSRTQELGIRLALGAWPGRLRRLVFQQAVRLVAAGLVVGMLAFTLASGLMRRMVYGVATLDAVTLVAVALVVGLVTLLATWAPARMATRVDPAAALRAE